MSFQLNLDAFSFYDPQKSEWVFEPGKFEILIGASSRDVGGRRLFKLS
ncbi:MAG: fibronectin type III-like domain-contianing protein [Pyrinomonadaceae bacterium]